MTVVQHQKTMVYRKPRELDKRFEFYTYGFTSVEFSSVEHTVLQFQGLKMWLMGFEAGDNIFERSREEVVDVADILRIVADRVLQGFKLPVS
jgi:hypothetical protein